MNYELKPGNLISRAVQILEATSHRVARAKTFDQAAIKNKILALSSGERVGRRSDTGEGASPEWQIIKSDRIQMIRLDSFH